jgi:integrase/recombinase XerD
MPRPHRIWYWKARKEWCVKINRVRHRLGDDKAEAERRFHELMLKKPDKPLAPDALPTIIDEFLSWTKAHREPGTFEWYHAHLQSFLDSLENQMLLVGRLTVSEVENWIDGHPTWGPTVRRQAMTALNRALNWADKRDRIDKNPLKGKLELPPAGKREQVISPAEFKTILALTKGNFQDLLVTAWETGCRPQELLRVEARHVDLDRGCWVFPVDEAKGKKRERHVYMPPAVLKIVRRLMKENPEGPLYRNQDEEPWTPDAVNCGFRRLQAAMGRAAAPSLEVPKSSIAARMKEIQRRRRKNGKDEFPKWKARSMAATALIDAACRKHAPKYCLYTFRHSYITNGLKKGIDPVTMANLVGHVDLKMIHAIYSHISKDSAFMLQAALKAAT